MGNAFGNRKPPCGAKNVTPGAFTNMSAILQNCRTPSLRLVKWAQKLIFF